MASICTRHRRPAFERRHAAQERARLVVEADEADQFLGPVEREDLAAAGVGFQGVGELSDRAGGFVGERQRQAVVGEAGWQAVDVFGGLGLDAGERVPFGLGLDDADRLAVGVEQVVGLARASAGTPGRPRRSRPDIHLPVVLHQPTRGDELLVDGQAGFLFGRHGHSARDEVPAE